MAVPLTLLGIMTLGDCIYQCNLGIDSENGVRAYCIGSPSNGTAWKVICN